MDFLPDTLLEPNALRCAVLAGITLFVSAVIVALRVRRGLLLTAATGLHLNTLFFMGLGPLCYVLFEPPPERVPYEDVLASAAYAGTFFTFGYFAAALLDWSILLRKSFRVSPASVAVPGFSLTWPIAVASASLLGYAGSRLDVALSGVGTVFPLLKTFLFPSIVLVWLRADLRQPSSVIPALCISLVAGIVTVLSPWRSELFLFAGCIGSAVATRKPNAVFPFAALTIALLMVLLPFQEMKKQDYESTREDMFESFRRSQQVSLAERELLLGNFLGLRVNGIRELAYVHSALDRDEIEYRNGETYWETFLQVIPRAFWTGKPSFNELTGRLLPRMIGLLGEEDKDTSWGVNLFAEFCWNFAAPWLLLFVPITFSVVAWLDRKNRRIFHSEIGIMLISTCLFFQMFQIVGVNTNITFLVWTYIVVFIIDRSIRPRSQQPYRINVARKEN